jgi:hypothetical protein
LISISNVCGRSSICWCYTARESIEFYFRFTLFQTPSMQVGIGAHGATLPGGPRFRLL